MAARDLRPDHDIDVQLTPMRRRHLRAVLRIEAQVYPRPWSLGLFLSELALRESRVYLVARVGTSIVGYSGLMLSGTDGHITTIVIDPAWHSYRIATRLLLALAGAAIDEGCNALTLEVRVSNDRAQALYRRFGFVPVGVRKGYYVETKEDALIMWAHDIDLPAYRSRLAEIEASVPGTTTREGSTE